MLVSADQTDSFPRTALLGLTKASDYELTCCIGYLLARSSLGQPKSLGSSSLSILKLRFADRLPGCTMNCLVRLASRMEAASDRNMIGRAFDMEEVLMLAWYIRETRRRWCYWR